MAASIVLAAGAARAAEDEAPAQLGSIVVTGTARASGVKTLETGFSVSTIGDDEIAKQTPLSSADVLRSVPGIFVESSGGVAGLHIGVRGFPQNGGGAFATVQIDGATIFAPPTLSFLEGFSLFRLDDTVERVEVLRGGPSPIFSNGQPGITANFIQKKGGDTPEGSLSVTAGTGGLKRVDGFWGGRIAEDTYATVGGFWRTSDGVRNTQFTADEGGQISGTLTRKLGGGDAITFSARKVHDSNAFFSGAPLVANADGSVTTFPGFDQRKDTLIGNETRYANLLTGPGGATTSADFSDGRTIDLTQLGLSLDLNRGGWQISDRAHYLKGSADVRGLFTSAAPQTLSSYIAGRVSAANASAATVAAAGRVATAGTARWVTTGQTITDPNQQVIAAGLWSIDKDIESLTNDLRVSRTFGAHTVTLGSYLAHYTVNDYWLQGSTVLLAAEPNARRIDVALDNGVAASTNGLVSATTSQTRNDWRADNAAVFAADEWQLDPRWRVDGGLRFEHYRARGTVGLTDTADFDGNPLTLYDNSGTYLTGATRDVRYSGSRTSYTLGTNYLLASDTAVFARLNGGYRFPHFDELSGGTTVTQAVRQYELGAKTIRPAWDAFATLFANDFKGQTYTQQVVDPATSAITNVTAVASSRVYGLELEGAVRPLRGLELRASGTLFHGEYRDIQSSTDADIKNGNRIQRQPTFQFRLAPSYRFALDNGVTVTLFGAWTHVGTRFSDIQNLQRLPSYDTLDAGVRFNRGNWEFQLTGTNLTNELALTEGNPRISGSATSSAIIGRALFGRAAQATLKYFF
ncbi:TonB-dependent receptor [Xylophilus sp.]|uniref:TonB-dependent receptor n=1 Tax=Xylophilus sp. TaxID=2653893 RepID=UPI002D7E792F|nr:TonB-dependent receptor [Xylophilus sp.]